ncbi:hypothetical protein BX611_2345 [Lutibacter oceani]|uniref:Uncharacterized protein n=1 Tax=Lutibacter oceani TaxID=1853311 RepID=A0A3D9RLD6_9FLAO|nr:hypothetical protein [Lutibacter oceani]REE80693.1 hypothetical protein BX611_2345 [Lutibacter oceani]
MENYINIYADKEKAIHCAIWLNFKHRSEGKIYGVIHGPDDGWACVEKEISEEMEIPFLDILPIDLSDISFDEIKKIKTDETIFAHWEIISGMLSITDGEVLRFILHTKLPLEKFIRYELASRGFDEYHKWCGFDNAEKIWLK